MSAAFDAATSTGAFAGVLSVSFSHTAGGSADYARLSAGALVLLADATTKFASCTYAGAAMTEVGTVNDTNAEGRGIAGILEKIAPSTGAQTVVLAKNNGGNMYGCGGAVSYTGVHQTTASGTASTNSSSTGSGSSTINITSSSGDMISDAIQVYHSSGGAPSGNRTSRFGAFAVGAFYWGSGQDTATSGTVAMTWSGFDNEGFAHVASAILQAGGGGVTVKQLAALGVG